MVTLKALSTASMRLAIAIFPFPFPAKRPGKSSLRKVRSLGRFIVGSIVRGAAGIQEGIMGIPRNYFVIA
jgi:hypothetical protein